MVCNIQLCVDLFGETLIDNSVILNYTSMFNLVPECISFKINYIVETNSDVVVQNLDSLNNTVSDNNNGSSGELYIIESLNTSWNWSITPSDFDRESFINFNFFFFYITKSVVMAIIRIFIYIYLARFNSKLFLDMNDISKNSYYKYDLLAIWFKVLFIGIITILARGIGPRTRPDQLSDFTWKDIVIFLFGFLIMLIIFMIL